VGDPLPPGTFVVVSGPPASGKTTLARAVAPALGLPLIAKDAIKGELRNDEVARPVAGGWPVIEVDTAGPVDVRPLVAAIRAAAGTGLPG
jgi:Ni2+-binding GTPase involved in maturation of urease and hydrogenase